MKHNHREMSVTREKLPLLVSIYCILVTTPTISNAVLEGRHKSLRPHGPSLSLADASFGAHRIHPTPAAAIKEADNEPKSNGSAILEDLVSQFLEKTREAVRRGGGHALDLELEPTNPSHGTPVERSSQDGEAADILAAESAAATNNQQLAAQVFGTGSLAQLGPQEVDELAVVGSPGEQQLRQEPDDRRIQYDFMRHQQVDRNQLERQQQQLFTSLNLENGSRHLSDYKLGGVQHDEQMGSTNGSSNGTVANQDSLSMKPLSFQSANSEQETNRLEALNQLGAEKDKEPLNVESHRRHLESNSSAGDPMVTLNSSDVVEVVAPSPLIGSEPVLSNVTGRSFGGSSVQARSMHSGPAAQLKAPQHTRPPYATSDQFSGGGQRGAPEVESGSVGAANSTNKGKSSSIEPQESDLMKGEAAPSSGTGMDRKVNDEKLHKLSNSQLVVELSPKPAPSRQQPQDSSGDRLHFSKENSLFNSPNRGGHNDRYSAAQSGSSGNNNQLIYEQPANTFGDLSASGGGFYLNSQLIDHQSPERHQKNESQESQRSDRLGTRGSGTQASNSMDVAGSKYQPLEMAESQQHPFIGELNLNKPQMDRHHHHHHQGNRHHLQPPSASGALLMAHRTPPPSHYPASLINVTSPMLPPLSASEAMESELAAGSGLSAKTLLNQVSGLLRPASQFEPVSSGRVQLNVSTRTPQQQQQQPQYYLPAFAGSGESIYSPPANQFVPKIGLSVLNDLQTSDSLNSSTLSSLDKERMRLDGSGYIIQTNRRPPTYQQQYSTTMNVSQPQHQASGFRSPGLSQGSLTSTTSSASNLWPSTSLPLPSSYLSGSLSSPAATTQQQQQLAAASSSSSSSSSLSTLPLGGGGSSSGQTQQAQQNISLSQQAPRPASVQPSQGNQNAITTSGSSTGPSSNFSSVSAPSSQASISTSTTNGFLTGATGTGGGTGSGASATASLNRRVFNLTRVEHISAECSNDLIRTVIVFNGTFKGIIYSSGYVRDPNCLYINGTGKTRYDFSIRLNQCGTLGRQELHPPTGLNEVRRRDQVMWNTLSIQYNPIIEQEWDEHFKVSCEYGSDFWKTVSFSPFNVETNTGAPMVFTVDPPQCQMEILRGHGMVGPRQEAVSGPVTVGDPLTLLIHMKSEKSGYDILVKNCIAHNGGHQKMQLIDSNGCVVNERFISPFRGVYNDADFKHVTLFSYLKAFRFTGSPVLYLECEIHMCSSHCPPQMCYWRTLSKRSVNETNLLGYNSTSDDLPPPTLIDESPATTHITTKTIESQSSSSVSTMQSATGRSRRARRLDLDRSSTTAAPAQAAPTTGQMSDKLSLFQALEVRQERSPDAAPYSLLNGQEENDPSSERGVRAGGEWPLMCYRQAEVLAFLFTAVSMLLVALSVSVGCCWRAKNLRLQFDRKRLAMATSASGFSSANSSPLSPSLSCSALSLGGSSGCLSSLSSRSSEVAHQQAALSHCKSQNFYAQYRRAMNPPLMSQNHSKQRHKDYLLPSKC